MSDLPQLVIRITPLLRGRPPVDFGGGPVNVPEAQGGVQGIDPDDVLEVTQFERVQVDMAIGEGRTGTLVISMYEPVVETLAHLEQAVWIGYLRPGETWPEPIIYAQAGLTDDFIEETVTLHLADPAAAKAQAHYQRRGDPALNVDKNRGRLPAHVDSITTLLEAARNTPEQQAREMPALGLGDWTIGVNFPNVNDVQAIWIERGQEAWALVDEIGRLAPPHGPDIDIEPWMYWPPATPCNYATAMLYDSPGDPDAPHPFQLGRNLAPADPDAPVAGDVIFEEGLGLDNARVRVPRGQPITHAHVLDADGHYRVTRADAESSYKIGAWVGWHQADIKLDMPTRQNPEQPSLEALEEIAEATIIAYGVPPDLMEVTMRPDAAQAFHYGNPQWETVAFPPPGTPVSAGHWYLGDYVPVRAVRGYRSFAGLARITAATFLQEGPNANLQVNARLVPARGGAPGFGEEGDDLPPTVAITSPAAGAVSGTVALAATASDDVGVISVEFRIDGVLLTTDLDAPYAASWDTTAFPDGPHAITALATDTGGNTTLSTAVNVTVANATPPPPVDPPAPGVNELYVDGRRIRKTSDGSIAEGRGMNVHANGFAFGQEIFDELAEQGFTDLRVCAQWDDIEHDGPGMWNEANLDFIHLTLERAATAGLRSRLLLLINDPNWSQRASYIPPWTYTPTGPAFPVAPWNTASMFDVLASSGEGYIRKMIQEFASEVYGFEFCNEPDRLPASYVQSGIERMLTWARDEPAFAGKLWYATNAYSSQSADDAYNDWDAITDWTNGVLTVHSYFAPTSPGDDGWQSGTGMRDSRAGTFWNGSPEASSYSTLNKEALYNHFASWMLKSQELNVPVELGEIGVQYNKATAAQRSQWMLDNVEAAERAGFAMMHWWIMGVTTSGNPWTASLVYPPVIRPEVVNLTTFVAP